MTLCEEAIWLCVGVSFGERRNSRRCAEIYAPTSSKVDIHHRVNIQRTWTAVEEPSCTLLVLLFLSSLVVLVSFPFFRCSGDSWNNMAGFAYQALGRSSTQSENALPLKATTNKELSTTTVDVGDCLDLLTCVCYLLPCDSVLNDEEDLPLSQAASDDKSSTDGDSGNDNQKIAREDSKQRLMVGSTAVDGYDLTSIVADPPMHLAATDRQYGLCPLGHQEMVYFKEASI